MVTDTEVLILGFVGCFVAWRMFEWLKKRPQKFKLPNMQKQQEKANFEEMEDNPAFNIRWFKHGEKILGKVIGEDYEIKQMSPPVKWIRLMYKRPLLGIGKIGIYF